MGDVVVPVGSEQLDEWERLAEKATPGPWFTDQPLDEGQIFVGNRADGRESGLWAIVHVTGDAMGDLKPEAAQRDRADAEFIAAARTGLPLLAAEVRCLSAQVEAVREIHVRGRLEPVHGKPERFVCEVCTDDEAGDWQLWPCPTIAALAGGDDRG